MEASVKDSSRYPGKWRTSISAAAAPN
jgi:hypothetical protein